MELVAPDLTSCVYFNNPCELFGWAEMYILVKIKNKSSHILIFVIIFPNHLFNHQLTWSINFKHISLFCTGPWLYPAKDLNRCIHRLYCFSLKCLVTCTPKPSCTLLIALGSVFVINAWLLITITESDSSDSFHMLIKILAQTFYPIALFEFQIEKVRRCWFHLSRVSVLLRSNTECNIMLKAGQLQIKSPAILR